MQIKTQKQKPFRCLIVGVGFIILVLTACWDDITKSTSKPNEIQATYHNIEQLIAQADAAQASGNYDAEEKICRKIIQLEPNAVWAFSRLGSILQLNNKHDEAIALYRQLIQRNPQAAESYYELGKALLAKQKLSEAVSSYRQAVRLQPVYAVDIDWFAPYLSLEQVILTLSMEIQLHPEHAAIDFVLLGDAFRQARQSNQAMEFDQQNFAVFCQRYLQGCTKRYGVSSDQEVSAFQQAIQQDPQSIAAYESLGVSLYELNRYDKAIAAFRQAIQLDPKYVRGYYRLADVLIAQNQSDEAIKMLYQAAQIKHSIVGIDSGFWFPRQARQPRIRFIAALEQELQKRPSAVGYYILGNIQANLILLRTSPGDLKSDRDIAQAVISFRKSIRLDPTFAKAYDRMGFVLALQGKTKDAEQAFRKAIQLDFNLISSYDNLRGLLRTQKRFDEAAQIFRAMQSIAK